MPRRPHPLDLLTAGLAAAVAVRAFPDDGPWPTVAARAVLPWSVPVGLLATGGQALARRPRATVVTALATAALAAWSWPDRGAGRPDEVAPEQAWRLATANMLFVNRRRAELAAAVVALDADVVVLQEVTPRAQQQLLDGGLEAAYPHRLMLGLTEGFGSAVVSRYPLRDAEQHFLDRMLLVDVVVELPSGPVRVWCVHTVSPTRAERVRAWRHELSGMPSLRRGPEPLLAAGDFNATRQHQAFRRMTARLGLRDAFEQAGRGLGATFPVGGRVPVPLMRIDHVLVDDRVRVAGVRTVPLPGSDHLGLVADLG